MDWKREREGRRGGLGPKKIVYLNWPSKDFPIAMLLVQPAVSGRRPLTRRHSRTRNPGAEVSDATMVPTKRCGGGHDTQRGRAESDARKCRGTRHAHARRHPPCATEAQERLKAR